MTVHEFSVYWFDPDGKYYAEARFIDVKAACQLAKSLMERPAAQFGIIRRVIITDGGDHTCFEWKHGVGITYPPEEAAA